MRQGELLAAADAIASIGLCWMLPPRLPRSTVVASHP
jgi:hypothetical protein